MPILNSLGQTHRAVICDDDFAEALLLSAMMNGAQPDTTRGQTPFRAVLRTGGGEERNLAGGYAQSWRTRIASDKAQLHIDIAAYPDLVIKQHDKVRALDRRGRPWFSIARIDDRDAPRLILELDGIG